MPEVQNIGAANYAMPVQQNQYATEVPVEDNIPMVYDPDMEAQKKAASNKLGLTLLGIALLGTGLAAGRMWGKSGQKAAAEELEKMKDVAKEVCNDAKKVENSTLGGYRFGKDFAKTTQEKFKPFLEDAEKTAEELAEEAKDIAKDAAKETK